MNASHEDADAPTRRLKAVEDALHKVQEQGAALEDLAERLSLSVHVLEAEVAALARELRDRPAPAAARAEPVVAKPQAPPRSADAAGARLVALDMALAGEERQAVERYLAEHFALDDLSQLLDEVYAALGSSTSRSAK